MNSNKNFAKFINIDGKYRFYNDESDLIKIYQEELDQLTNNWNELEECIANEIRNIKSNYSQVNGNYFNMNYVIDAYEEVLDKMKKIKEGNNGR